MEYLDSLGFLIITLNCNVTIMGKIWFVFMVLLRMAVIVLAGSPVYQDEQERFVCNTLQPGCANVCYDIFSPVSHLRFWLVQGVSALLPSAVFSVYVIHKAALLAAQARGGPDAGRGGPEPLGLTLGDSRGPLPCREGCTPRVPDFSWAYIVHLFLRTLTEVAFGALHYLLFGLVVPKRFSCTHSPCTSVVDCYVSRPTEKSIMMLFVGAVSALSFFLSVADLSCSLRRRLRGRRAPGCAPTSVAPRLGDADLQGEAGWTPTQPGLWAHGEGTDGPRAKSSASGRTELPDEEESEVLSSSSDKTRARPHREAAQDAGSEGPARADQRPIAPGDQLAIHYPSCQLQSPTQPASAGGTSHLRPRKSEWV